MKATVNSNDAGRFVHNGDRNSFQFDPPLAHQDALALAARAEQLGYQMLFREAGFSQAAVQAQLVERGPSAFLNLARLQEDISPKEPPATAEERMKFRMRKLAPIASLVITDPYLFTGSRSKDCEAYAAAVGNIISPALTEGLHITAIVSPSQNNGKVRGAVEAELRARAKDVMLSVVESDDFHDRFWIADRARGIVIGTSFNKIGRRIFFVDDLSEADVAAVLAEVDQVLDPYS